MGGQCIDENCGQLPSPLPAFCTSLPVCAFRGCRAPQILGPTFEAVSEGGGQYKVKMIVDVIAPFNEAMKDANPNGTLDILWWSGSGVPNPPFSNNFNELLTSDRTKSWVEFSGFTCSNVPQSKGTFTVRAQTCGGTGTCGRVTDLAGLDFLVTPGIIPGCPPPTTCNEPSGNSASGEAGSSCPLCRAIGGGGPPPACSVPLFGGGPSCMPEGSGPGAFLRYAAGGVGGDGFPGSAGWRVGLGRFWSHDYAERIIVDPDFGHVWLLTKYGAFRSFTQLDAGTGLRRYRGVSPSDEFRQLYFDTATGTWQLRSLDGRTDFYRSDGQWDRSVLASDPSHPTQASYSAGQLTGVTFPDGRSETFAYHPGGKLKSITAIPVAGSGTPVRTWNYTWVGEELRLISRPDGTAWELTYDSARPGYLLQVRRVGTDLSGRIEAAFEYEAGSNNVLRSWRGDPSFTGPNAVDKATYTYSPAASPIPTQVLVAEEVRTGPGGFTRTTVTTFGRDTASAKPRVAGIQGSCPSCGLSPNTTFSYLGTNPLLPSAITDPKGTRTDFSYNANGRMIARTEAANIPALLRLTSSTYDANFPGRVARIDRPSTEGGGNLRTTAFTFDPSTGRMTAQTIEGFEGGTPIPSSYRTTSYTHNSSGEVLSIEPPGFDSADQTTFTYDLPNRNGHIADTRTDPVVGTTTFAYDGFNRRTAVTDPNGVRTTTTYDPLDRVIEVRQEGETILGDLVTTNTYNVFGDPYCTRLPRGNGIESRYDPAGRLTEVRRGTAVPTPSATNCLEPTPPLERTLYAYDLAGHRTEERRQSWNGAEWIESGFTGYTYTCHLDKTTQGSGGTESVTEYCYDLNDNLEQVWDAKHPRASFPTPSTSYSYDALNRMKTATQPWGGAGGGTATTSYDYDVQDHLRLVIDANQNMTTYETGDRDLMTEESSPVFSGATNFTTYSYDEHGNLAMKTDPRGVTVMQEHDPADRMTLMNPPGSDLDTTYVYDSPSVDFSKGRLTSISRPGSTIAYEYDRFGRMTNDGSLTYGYDPNSNRTTITYSPTVALCYGFDALDRPITLKHTASGGDPCFGSPLVSAASYLPSGPLTRLTFGNGLTETRQFDARYYPKRIQVPGALGWDYTVDTVGNPTLVSDLLNPAGSRTYGYQDYQYFLTSAAGPWADLAWTYDRIGNRLSETEVGEPLPFTYSYSPNGMGGNTPKLTKIQPRPNDNGNGAITQSYDPAGNQITHLSSNPIAGPKGSGKTSTLTYSAESKLSGIAETPGLASTTFQYDGRGFLRDALLTYAEPGDFEHTEPVYSSSGQLFGRRWRSRRTFGTPQDDGTVGRISEDQTAYVFYFAGRPVAQLTTGATGPGSGLVYLTADHLGTPVLATNPSGTTIWSGGFSPFGEPYQLMPPTLFLRLPGQWTDRAWEGLGGGGIYYNVHRWYGSGVGRYSAPDPVNYLSSGVLGGFEYGYARNRPQVLVDPLGLLACKCYSDCPGGEWDFVGIGGGGSVVGGGSYTKGVYTCTSRPTVRFPATVSCRFIGPIFGVGIGIEGPTPFAASACGCNVADLLGKQSQIIGSAGPFGMTVSGCGKGPFSIGDRTVNVSVGKTIGAGLAYAVCSVEVNGVVRYNYPTPTLP